jgi:sestrin
MYREDAMEDDTEDDNEVFDKEMMDHMYADYTSLDMAWKVMGEHTEYLTSFLRLHYALLTGDGPLPAPTRHLIVLLASARFSCSYLVEYHRTEFLRLGGRREVLDKEGLAGVPKKILKLYELNKILAHRPWTLTAQHITDLTAPGADNWSLSELVYAIVLMVHAHSFASFLQSCALLEEGEKENLNERSIPCKAPYDCTRQVHKGSPSTESYRVEQLVQKMQILRGKQDSPPPQEELRSRFQTMTLTCSEVAPCAQVLEVEPDMTRFVRERDFQYVDFARRGRESEFPTFRIQDFNWDEEGYSMISQFYDDVAHLLDDKFRTIYNLTYRTMGRHSSIDTSLFRRASWNYIQCLWGIRHDDYDYAEVNDLLHRSLKKYIKTASCFPDQCSRLEYNNIMKDFNTSEKVGRQ